MRFAVLFILTFFIENSVALVGIQPWPIKVERSGLCCNRQRQDFQIVENFNETEVNQLQICLNKQQELTNKNGNVSIVTFSSSGYGHFAISDIEEFAVYQRALLGAFAETNGFVFRHIGEGVDFPAFEKEPDARWLKIKILLDALDTWAKDSKYIMWIDSDAVVLDYGLDIERLGRLHPKADIIASADVRMGLINTGVLLLRNTPWLKVFLNQWWYGPHSAPGRVVDAEASRKWRSVCDQDAFDKLYSHHALSGTQGSPLMTDKVLVLPMDALNSNPPAMLHQKSESPVLHLMGEATALRRELFRRAWGNVCAARSGGVLPAQLGLHREILLSYARVIYGEAVQKSLNAAQNVTVTCVVEQERAGDITGKVLSEEEEEGRLQALLVFPLQELSKAAHHLCDILHHLHSATVEEVYSKEEVQLRRSVFDLVLERVNQTKGIVSAFTEYLHTAHAALEALGDGNASIPEPPMMIVNESDEELKVAELVLRAAETARWRRSLLGVHVQLLKRAAEAGNDLFGAESAPVDKLRIATTVLGILDELEKQVDEQSRHVPTHMRALMHQSLGVLEHSMAQNPQTLFVHSNPSQKAVKIKLDEEMASVHLREAYKHFKTSVSLFSTLDSLANSYAQDGSTLMEVSRSLQLLAGVTCSLGRFSEGTHRWEGAIAHARRSLKGIELGVRFDNLAVVLYNAAVCLSSAGDSRRVEELLAEAARIVDSSVNGGSGDGSLRRYILDLRAKNAGSLSLATTAGEKGLPAQDVVVNSKPLINTAKNVGVMRSVVDPATGQVTYVRTKASISTMMATAPAPEAAEEAEKEWVECELDEACDEYEVVVDAPMVAGAPSAPPPADEDADVLLGIDIEDMTEEDVQELRETRQRYARQHKKSEQRKYQQEAEQAENEFLADQQARRPTPSPLPAADVLLKLETQLLTLEATHQQQGRLIDELKEELQALRARR